MRRAKQGPSRKSVSQSVCRSVCLSRQRGRLGAPAWPRSARRDRNQDGDGATSVRAAEATRSERGREGAHEAGRGGHKVPGSEGAARAFVRPSGARSEAASIRSAAQRSAVARPPSQLRSRGASDPDAPAQRSAAQPPLAWAGGRRLHARGSRPSGHTGEQRRRRRPLPSDGSTRRAGGPGPSRSRGLG